LGFGVNVLLHDKNKAENNTTKILFINMILRLFRGYGYFYF
jgi:hypothetical protein